MSIVGIDDIPFGYYRQKLRCEELIADSPVASTILRATQFHELAARVLQALQRSPLAPLPSGFLLQPVAAREVAERLVDLLDGSPAGRCRFRRPGGSAGVRNGRGMASPLASTSSVCLSSPTGTCRQSVPRGAQHLFPPRRGPPDLAGIPERNRAHLTSIGCVTPRVPRGKDCPSTRGTGAAGPRALSPDDEKRLPVSGRSHSPVRGFWLQLAPCSG